MPPYSSPCSNPFTHITDPSREDPPLPRRSPPRGEPQSPVPPHPGGLSQAAGTGRGAAPGGAEAEPEPLGASREPSRGAPSGQDCRVRGGRARVGGRPGPTMNTKKRGRTRLGASKASGTGPRGRRPGSGPRSACFAEAGWGSAEELSPPRPGWRRTSVTQFPGGSRMKEEGAGPFSASRPALGIPRPGGRRDAGAGGGWGEQVTLAGRGQATNPHRLGLSGSSAELRACALPRPVTSSASGGGGARAPGALGGGRRGQGWGGRPAPG